MVGRRGHDTFKWTQKKFALSSRMRLVVSTLVFGGSLKIMNLYFDHI